MRIRKNCSRTKIAVLANVTFSVPGEKIAVSLQRNGLYAPNLQRRRGRIYKCEIRRNLKKSFCRLMVPFRVDGHIYIYIHLRTCIITQYGSSTVYIGIAVFFVFFPEITFYSQVTFKSF